MKTRFVVINMIAFAAASLMSVSVRTEAVNPRPQGKGGEIIAKPSPSPAGKSQPSRRNPASPPGSNSGKSLPAKFTNIYRMEFVLIPAGNFMMGSAEGNEDSEKPVHRVTIGRPYYLGRYEVTQRQWMAVMATTVDQQRRKESSMPGGSLRRMAGEGENLPMYYVSWQEAKAFIARLNALNDGYLYRLPSEAEWEYACRAGGSGEQPTDLGALAWYKTNSNDAVHEVGMRRANAFGLYDMLGNVWEWCEDLAHENYEGAPADGSAWLGGVDISERRLRGAAFYTGNSSFWKCTAHGAQTEDYRDFETGFRVVATPRNP